MCHLEHFYFTFFSSLILFKNNNNFTFATYCTTFSTTEVFITDPGKRTTLWFCTWVCGTLGRPFNGASKRLFFGTGPWGLLLSVPWWPTLKYIKNIFFNERSLEHMTEEETELEGKWIPNIGYGRICKEERITCSVVRPAARRNEKQKQGRELMQQ